MLRTKIRARSTVGVSEKLWTSASYLGQPNCTIANFTTRVFRRQGGKDRMIDRMASQLDTLLMQSQNL